MSLPTMLALLLHAATLAPGGPTACASLVRSVDGVQVDLAPPTGYVEICSRDQTLCRTLTQSYPSSVTTLGYFVPAKEWEAHAKEPAAPFQDYLIAQVATTRTAAQLQQVKGFIHAQQSDIPERARLAERLQADGEAALGIFNDTPDSISFGAVSKMPAASATPVVQPLLAMTNSAFVAGSHLLSLYVYLRVTGVSGVDQVEDLTKHWLQCLRDAQRK